jgi:hypothetical protein
VTAREGGVRHAVTGTASSNRVTTLGYRAAVVRMRLLLGVMWGNFRRIQRSPLHDELLTATAPPAPPLFLLYNII